MSLKRLLFPFVFALACIGVAHGQATAPATGEITVQLVQGIDSSVNPNGKSEGRVTNSTNPAVPPAAGHCLD